MAEASSKYDHIICKDLIRKGSPSVYQLILKKEEIGTLAKMTFGKKDPNRTNKTILLVGETGTGKSTLINALVNYAMGVKWEDNVWFDVVEDDEQKGQFESQTSDVIVYEIFGFEDKTLPYSLTIIDTPGYGGTEGKEKDKVTGQRLLDLFSSNEGVYEVNVVGLVLKASDNRLSDRLKYVFNSVVSLFGKDLEEHIITLITHSKGKTPKDTLKALKSAGIKCAKNEKNQPVHFLFNNCQSMERNQDNSSQLDNLWKISSRGMADFTSFLQNLVPRNLKNTTEVLNSRIILTASIQNLRERVELIEKQQREIQQTQEALKKHEEEMKSNQNFSVQVDEVFKEKEKIRGGRRRLVFYKGAVCCNICEENCHYPGCTMAWSPRDCEVMKRGHCTVCKGRCPVSAHVKKKEKYVTKTRNVEMTLKEVEERYEKRKAEREGAPNHSEDPDKKHLEDLQTAKNALEERKEKYERNKADCEKTTGLLEVLEKEMRKLQDEKDQWLEESFKHVVKLVQIALNVDSLSTLLDFLIEKMKEKDGGEAEKVQTLEKMKSRVDKKQV